MNTRCRWILTSGVSRALLKAVAERMQADTYTRRRATGFILDEVRREHVVGSFFERHEWDDEVADPTGGVIAVHRVDLSRVRFRFATDAPQLELIDPPRSTKAFVTRLNEHADFKLAMTAVDIPPDKWLSALEMTVPGMQVVSLTSGDITVSRSVVAQIRLDGTSDVRAAAREQYPASLSRLHRVAVQWQDGGSPVHAELFGDGRATIGGPGEALGAVRSALVVAMNLAPGKTRGQA